MKKRRKLLAFKMIESKFKRKMIPKKRVMNIIRSLQKVKLVKKIINSRDKVIFKMNNI